MSAQVCVKKYAIPLPFIPSPHPSPPPYPPPQRQLPRANDIGPLDPVTSSANGVVSLSHSIGNPFRSAPPPPLLPSAGKTGSSTGEKVSHSRKGYVKNTWHGAKYQWEKQALKLRGDM